MTTDKFCFYLQNRLIQTSQTGGQQYSDTSPFSIPCITQNIIQGLESLGKNKQSFLETFVNYGFKNSTTLRPGPNVIKTFLSVNYGFS
jgi:hypothetical protein